MFFLMVVSFLMHMLLRLLCKLRTLRPVGMCHLVRTRKPAGREMQIHVVCFSWRAGPEKGSRWDGLAGGWL